MLKEDTLKFKQKIYKKMTEVLGKKAVARYEKPTLEDQDKRCAMYLEEIIGDEHYRTKKNKLNNKIETVCYKGTHIVCAKHSSNMSKVP